MSQPHILYHANCPDGFGAAWAAWKRHGRRARYLPVKHHEPPPTLEPGAPVFIVDFAYRRPVLQKMRDDGHELRVLDHHRTAQRDLDGFDGATFDLNKSGAVLAWEHFHPGEPTPELLLHVQDRDLWRHELDSTPEIVAALASHPMRFAVWDELAGKVDELREEGRIILRSRNIEIEQICHQARWSEVGGHRAVVVNATSHWSDVGNRLLERFPDAPFAAVYNDLADGRRKWSLRSRDSFDVSELAERLGGGGHPRAAGFVQARPTDAKST